MNQRRLLALRARASQSFQSFPDCFQLLDENSLVRAQGVDAAIDAMDAAGVEVALLSAWLHEGPGRGRVMFGTNWPMLTPEHCLSGIDALGLSDAELKAFRPETARQVLQLD